MSSRYEKEKRLRPRNNPYKRDQFNQTEYLRVPVKNKSKNTNDVQEDFEEEYYDEFYDDED
jgi:hypothetical protein